jgi:hypothetical protein
MVLMVTIGPAIDCSEPGARSPELEPVAGEGEGAGAVAVTRVGREDGKGVDSDFDEALLLRRGGTALGDLLEHVGQLITEEDRDDGRRGLVRSQPVVVGRRGDRGPQQPAELVHRADDGGAEDEELGVVMGRVPREEEVSLGGVADREVDVLA